MDPLLAQQLGLAGSDEACTVNSSINDYRPLALHDVTPGADSKSSLYCGAARARVCRCVAACRL